MTIVMHLGTFLEPDSEFRERIIEAHTQHCSEVLAMIQIATGAQLDVLAPRYHLTRGMSCGFDAEEKQEEGEWKPTNKDGE